MKTFTVILRDKRGFEIIRSQCEGLREAKEKARYFASEQFARFGAESTHEAMGSDRAEVCDERGCIVFDVPAEVETKV